MLKGLSTHFLQHLITQNSWAKPILKPFAGQNVLVKIFPARFKLTVLEDGSLCAAGETAPADATLSLSPSVLLRLKLNDETAHSAIELAGNTELATAFGQVMQAMHWDVEEDMSRVMGDIGAHQLVKFTRGLVQSGKSTALNLAEMMSEFWQEEQPLIAKQRALDAFNQSVDVLRDDIARLEKRIQKLAL